MFRCLRYAKYNAEEYINGWNAMRIIVPFIIKLLQYSVKSLKLFISFCEFSLRYSSRYYLFFCPWETPSVGGNVQTGRGGVLGKNLLVTTSYQYALSQTLTRVSLVTIVRPGWATAISRSFAQKSHAGHSSHDAWKYGSHVCISRFHAESHRIDRERRESTSRVVAHRAENGWSCVTKWNENIKKFVFYI